MIVLNIILSICLIIAITYIFKFNKDNIKKFIRRKINRNKIYTTEDALAYYLYILSKTKNMNYEEIIKRLENLMLDVSNNEIIKDKIDKKYFEEMRNRWRLSHNQVISYGRKIFEGLIIEEIELTKENVTEEFIILMRLYSPDNMEKFYDNKEVPYKK